MRVIDLSHHQNVTSYSKLDAWAEAFYIKVTQGSSYVDPEWEQHYNGLRKPKAPYHFMGIREDWSKQVRHFLATINKKAWQWPHVLDAEYDSRYQEGDPTSVDIKGWIREWRKQTGRYLIYVYLGRETWRTVAPPREWADSGTRIIGARYYRNNYDTAFQDFGFTDPNLDGIQYWNQGSVPGISNYVDLNNFKRIVTDNPVGPSKKSSILLTGAINA